jgi:choline dehydrogenase-like flavoprotein
MDVDSRSLEDGAVVEAEVCIVGGGAAGITLALELSGQSFRVALIESGGLDFDPETDALLEAINVGRSYPHLQASRLRYFGGSTNHWGGHCVPIRAVHFERRPWIPDSGWPISRDDLDPYYVRAHAILGLGEFDYDAKRLSAALGKRMFPFDPSKVETVISRYNPLRFGPYYHDVLQRADNLTTYLWGNLVRLDRHPSNSYVTQLAVRTLAGNAYTVRARYFVLALGGIENARMLLLSNAIEAAGLGNQHGLVGRYFMEHIRYWSGVILPANQAEVVDLYGAEHPYASDLALRGHLALPEQLLSELEIPSYRAEIKISKNVTGSDAVYSAGIIERELKTFRWPDHLATHLLNVLSGLDDLARYFVTSDAVLGYKLMNYVEQTPNPDSRIGLAQERDALGLNRATVDWRLTELDKIGIRKALKVIADEIGRSGFGRMRIDLSEHQDVILEGADGGAHHLGTTRMHDDPRHGVVDADCRMHDLANCFIAGSSTFPCGGYENPTLTIVAMAIRLGDHLKALMSS